MVSEGSPARLLESSPSSRYFQTIDPLSLRNDAHLVVECKTSLPEAIHDDMRLARPSKDINLHTPDAKSG
jgi:hypothetical protein